MKEKMNLKKLLVFVVASAFAPVLTQYAGAVQSGADVSFTAATILLPAAANLVTVLGALFTNPRYR